MPGSVHKYKNIIYRVYCFPQRSHNLDLNTRTKHNKTGKVRRRKTGALSRNHCYSRKAPGITYSECVSVALGMLRATRTRRIILSSLACLTLPYFPTLSHKIYDFQGSVEYASSDIR